jgi:hypothetical protein
MLRSTSAAPAIPLSLPLHRPPSPRRRRRPPAWPLVFFPFLLSEPQLLSSPGPEVELEQHNSGIPSRRLSLHVTVRLRRTGRFPSPRAPPSPHLPRQVSARRTSRAAMHGHGEMTRLSYSTLGSSTAQEARPDPAAVVGPSSVGRQRGRGAPPRHTRRPTE